MTLINALLLTVIATAVILSAVTLLEGGMFLTRKVMNRIRRPEVIAHSEL